MNQCFILSVVLLDRNNFKCNTNVFAVLLVMGLLCGIKYSRADSADELSKTLTEKMKPMLCETKFLNTEKWMVINVSNNVFNDAKKSHGGELLWKTAEVIANVSHRFYKTISAIEV